jgi:hypothetical protein
MKTTTNSKRRIPVLLSILCAGLVATFLGGCAESPYVAYNPGYYPTGYRGYSYYNPYPYSYYGHPTIRSYAQASATTTRMVRGATPEPFTAIGNNLRRAVG